MAGRGAEPHPDRQKPLMLPGVNTKPSKKPGRSHVRVVYCFGRIIGFIEDVRRRPLDEGKGHAKKSVRPFLATSEHGAFLTYADNYNEALLRVYQNAE